MAKNLVIVESPAKMKTVKKFLGANYTVEASNGHVRDFPKSQFGIDVDNDFEPKYITIRGKGELLAKLRKEAKKAYRADVDFNEEIDISKFVVDELNKFDTELGKKKVEVYKMYLMAGLDGIKNASLAEAKSELKSAKALPKSNLEEKEERKFFIELARSKVSAVKAYNKYFGSVNELRELDFAVIDDYFAQEDSLDDKIAELAKLSHVAKKDKDADEVKRLKAEIKKYSDERKKVRNLSKAEMDKHAQFNRAAKPYVDAKKVLTQYENFQHLDEIAAQYDEAKARAEAEEKAKELENERKRKELEAELAKRKAARKKK